MQRVIYFLAIFCLAVLGGVSILPAAAHAHSLHVFATGTGDTIDGYAYFSGGARPRQARITLQTTDGMPLYSGTTDDQGAFRLRVSQRRDYRIHANSGDGHIADFILGGDELSPDLPQPDATTPASAADVTLPPVTALAADGSEIAARTDFASGFDTIGSTGTTGATGANAPSANPSSSMPDGQNLANLVDAAVARHINPLRAELAAAQDRARLSDIMGGIGVIFGIFGVLAWVKSRKAPHKADADTKNNAGAIPATSHQSPANPRVPDTEPAHRHDGQHPS